MGCVTVLKRKQEQRKNNNFIKILACLLFIAAVVSGSALMGFSDNFLFSSVSTAQNYLFGKFPVLLAILLLAFSIKLFNTNWLSYKKLLFLFMFVLCLTGTAHNIFVPVGEETYPDRMLAGGGLIGGIFTLIIHKLIGLKGSWGILLTLWAVVLYIIIPFKKIYTFIKKRSEAESLKKQQKATAAREAAAEEKQINKTERKVFDFLPKDNVYKQEEFASFADGIHKKSAFRKILDFKHDNAYKDKKVQADIARNPVDIPEWEEKKVITLVRPIIDYENYAPGIAEETPAVQEFKENKALADKIFKHVPEQTAEVEAATGDNSLTTAAAPAQEEKKIVIFDSADKADANNTAVNEVRNTALVIDAEDDRYIFPEVGLLDIPKVTDAGSYEKEIFDQCSILEQTLSDFRVKATVTAVTRGPSVTRFELEPAPGVKVSAVVNLADDIALKLAAPGVRIEAPIPGKAAIGIEVPNIKNDQVYFREVVDNKLVYSNESKLCIGLGKNISGDIITADLAKMPHLLVAGSTGSGKSVCINTIIAGILYKASPDEVKFILVDPKVVELSNYNGIPHLLTPVVTNAKKAASALHWAVAEMERRYKLFADGHVREINSYNSTAEEKLPFIVIIIDELSDLMMVAKADVEDAILRLAQKARAAGIHLILATQRPSVDVITGIVKANIPSRIAFAVSSQTDSRTILDMGGAEKLLGKGDMLYYPIGQNKPVRVQGAFVSDAELNRIVDFIIKQSIPVNYSDEITSQILESESKQHADNADNSAYDDELFEEAVRLVMDLGQASSSMLQRKFRIGYTRAARLVDIMEELGIVGQSAGSKPRELILSRQEIEERFLKRD